MSKLSPEYDFGVIKCFSVKVFVGILKIMVSSE